MCIFLVKTSLLGFCKNECVVFDFVRTSVVVSVQTKALRLTKNRADNFQVNIQVKKSLL